MPLERSRAMIPRFLLSVAVSSVKRAFLFGSMLCGAPTVDSIIGRHFFPLSLFSVGESLRRRSFFYNANERHMVDDEGADEVADDMAKVL